VDPHLLHHPLLNVIQTIETRTTEALLLLQKLRVEGVPSPDLGDMAISDKEIKKLITHLPKATMKGISKSLFLPNGDHTGQEIPEDVLFQCALLLSLVSHYLPEP